ASDIFAHLHRGAAHGTRVEEGSAPRLHMGYVPHARRDGGRFRDRVPDGHTRWRPLPRLIAEASAFGKGVVSLLSATHDATARIGSGNHEHRSRGRERARGGGGRRGGAGRRRLRAGAAGGGGGGGGPYPPDHEALFRSAGGVRGGRRGEARLHRRS